MNKYRITGLTTLNKNVYAHCVNVQTMEIVKGKLLPWQIRLAQIIMDCGLEVHITFNS